MTAEETFVIVGASLAGAKAAETLAGRGLRRAPRARSAPRHERPYERPPLSKEYLRGEAGREKVYVHAEGFYAEQDIELRLGRTAVGLDASASELALDDGERLRYDRLLLATGAEPRRLAIPGGELDGVAYLRSVEDSDALRDRLDAGGTVVVIGAGWIGCEVAASARQRGLRGHGRRARVGAARARAGGRGRRRSTATSTPTTACGCCWAPASRRSRATTAVERVRTSDGRTLDCDLVVVGVGVQPRTELAAGAGIAVENGILVDAQLQTGAAGRVRGRRRRPTPTTPSTASRSAWSTGPTRCTRGRSRPERCSAATTSTTGCRTSSPTSTTSAWSTRASRARGTGSSSAAIPPSREFIAFWMVGDRVVAGMNVNVWDVTDADPAADPRAGGRRRPQARGRRRSARGARPG